MSLFSSVWSVLFPSIKAVGTPADHKISHDKRDESQIDATTGIAEDSGQEINNTSIDPYIQDGIHGFPVKDPENL